MRLQYLHPEINIFAWTPCSFDRILSDDRNKSTERITERITFSMKLMTTLLR